MDVARAGHTHKLRIRYQTRIPILGSVPKRSPLWHAANGTLTRSDYRSLITDLERRTHHMTILKPGRRLGATWMSDFIGQRKSVSLCADCQRKYSNWHEKVGYHVRDNSDLTDCDGCGQVLQNCKSYYSSLM